MTAITFDVLARDFASSVNKKIGDSFESLEKRVSRSARNMVAAVGVGFGAEKIVEFGRASVDAFERTQASQRRLEDAFIRFPKLADTNFSALKKLDDEISRRTGFLTRDIEAGQANLAQFNLTGDQLKRVTPLLVDYADKTGQDIPTAATMLGRALLGNQRALKSIGISLPAVSASAKEMAKAQHEAEASTTALAKAQDHLNIMIAELRDKRRVSAADELRYRDAQNAVRDAYTRNQAALASLRAEQDKTAASGSLFDQIFAAMTKKVGGFANNESQSAQGQIRKLRKDFDDTEVAIGAQLLPKLLDLGHFLTGTFIPDLEHVGGWLQHNSDVIVPLVKVVGELTLAVYATNKMHTLFASASKAAAIWTKVLGDKAGTAAIEVAAEGSAAEGAAIKTAALKTQSKEAAAMIAAEGDAAVTASIKLDGLLAKLKSLPLYTVGAFSDQHTAVPKGWDSPKVQAALKAMGNFPPSVRRTAQADLEKNVGFLRPGGAQLNDAAFDEWAKRWGLAGAAKDRSNDLPARGTLNAVLAAALRKSEQTASHSASKVEDILGGLPQFAVGSGYGIAEGIAKGIKAREEKALAAAKSLASKLQAEINQINSTLSSFKDTVASRITDEASLLNSGNQTVAGLMNFERHQASISTSFTSNLAKMAKLGYDPSFISQLAQAGPEQAGNIAAQLVTADVAQRNALNRDARAIASTAQRAGDVAAQSYYAKQARQMDALERQLKLVNKNINNITSDLETLARTGHLQTKVGR